MLAELNSTLLTSKTSFNTSDMLLSNLLGLDSHSYDGNDFDHQLAQLATHRVVCHHLTQTLESPHSTKAAHLYR